MLKLLLFIVAIALLCIAALVPGGSRPLVAGPEGFRILINEHLDEIQKRTPDYYNYICQNLSVIKSATPLEEFLANAAYKFFSADGDCLASDPAAWCIPPGVTVVREQHVKNIERRLNSILVHEACHAELIKNRWTLIPLPGDEEICLAKEERFEIEWLSSSARVDGDTTTPAPPAKRFPHKPGKR